MTHPATSFAPAHLVPLIDESSASAARAGVILQTADSTEYRARHVEIQGARLLNFGSCSYLDLEQRAELKEGAMDATRRYGTQFPFPRTYLQSPLYERLETALSAMTGGHVLVAPSTTLAHIAALPVLVEPGDAVLVDQFAHASLHTATALLRGIPVEHVRHNRVDLAHRKIQKLAKSHRRVWYLVDGLYSMLGDLAPLAEIESLLAECPQVYAYIDDAHSTSWLGHRGRGLALERLRDRSRVVVTLSLNKAFAAGGGALVLPDADLRSKIRRCGGPMMFSGPIQPPMLGAAAASAELHLRPEFEGLQAALRDRIDLVLSSARALDLPLANNDRTPIFFVRCGASNAAFGLARALQARGVYACASAFPAVPQNQAGIRFTVSLHNSADDIGVLLDVLAAEIRHLGEGVRAAGPGIASAPPRADESGVLPVAIKVDVEGTARAS